jgi:hypothetical protein
LEGEEYIESPHGGIKVQETPAANIEARNYGELAAAILGFVTAHEDTGLINVYGYDGDVDADVELACGEVRADTPIGAFAVSDMTWFVTKIVSYYEIEVNITYRRTKQQLDGMVAASSLRYLKSELLDMMGRYSESAIINTRLGDITDGDVLRYIEETYYENPLEIIMLPVADVGVFPERGAERIIEITFGQRNPSNIALTYAGALARAARNIAETVSGSSDGEILLSLLSKLIDSSEYDADAAQLGQYSTQNFNATAYGALVYGTAIGEGYAMAYKALCDELGLECTVVLGELAGLKHAWNIARINGDYYHIDAAMCDLNGIETAFLKNDAEMPDGGYSWDAERYPVCAGPLTYADFYTVEAESPEDDGAETETGADADADAGADADVETE